VHPGLELRAGIDNLFEKDPPPVDQGLAASNIDSGNTFPGTYDVLGRTFFVGATAKF
jgi:iron complex outermembrane receptor protein